MERTSPRLFDGAAGILAGLGVVAEVGEVRVDGAVDDALAVADALLKPAVLSAGAQRVELLVRVEDERRPGETARGARRSGVQADDEEGVTGEAEREVRALRIAADARVPRMVARVEVVQALQLRPQPPLEGQLGAVQLLAED